MPNEPRSPDDTVPPNDPFDADLVAYLDGELEPAAARQVEGRLAADPAARAKAAALKKTFDLLDYLPRPEPSADFASRTLDKIPAMKSAPVAVSASPAAHAPGAAAGSSSVPVPLSTGILGLPVAGSRRWLRVAGVVGAFAAFVAAGYFGTAALRPRPESAAREVTPEELPLSDHRSVENLPLYAAADDFEFVLKLADSDLFGDEPAVSFAAPLRVPAVDRDKPSGPAFASLAKAFQSLPQERQQAIRELDRQVYAQPAAVRDRLLRVLEVYAVWLDRLPESERRGVLTAATPAQRLGVIQEIRERQWIDSLPAAQRTQLTGLDPARRAERIGEWKRAEAERRDDWADVRRNASAIAANQVPWPFDSEPLREGVIEFMRVTFHIDDGKKSRLMKNEYDRYTAALATAEAEGGWAWYAYGREALGLVRKYERFLLPEPADPKLLYDDFSDLPRAYDAKLNERPALRNKLAAHVGNWPDFALELSKELRVGKFGVGPLPPLGPARPGDFKEPVRVFWESELLPKLSEQERRVLRMLEGRWPEYPEKLRDLARSHDLSVPGVMLPGSPRMWEKTYGITRPAGFPNGRP